MWRERAKSGEPHKEGGGHGVPVGSLSAPRARQDPLERLVEGPIRDALR